MRKKKRYENQVNYNNRSEQQKRSKRNELANIINNTRIAKLPVIAQAVKDYAAINDYQDKFAYKIVEQKLIKTKEIEILDSQCSLSFGIKYEDVFYGVDYSVKELFPNNSQSYLATYIENFETKLNQEGFGFRGGILHFLPFIMNKNSILKKVESKIPIKFINLPYNHKSLEGLTEQYSNL
jgi:hypothetical protein